MTTGRQFQSLRFKLPRLGFRLSFRKAGIGLRDSDIFIGYWVQTRLLLQSRRASLIMA